MKIVSVDPSVKKYFLDFIEEKKSYKLKSPNEDISKTNFVVGESPLYEDELRKLFSEHLEEYIPLESYKLTQIWYQWYEKNSNSFHGFHHHESWDSQVSAIYYLKLEDPSLRTEFLDKGSSPQFGKIYVPPVEEGDMILFDAAIDHRSPHNKFDCDKIILSFNLQTDASSELAASLSEGAETPPQASSITSSEGKT